MPEQSGRFLDRMFHPESIAIIGASSTNIEDGWVRRLQVAGYKGKIFPINPTAQEISGVKVYPSILDVPGPVEYAIFAIPARVALRVMGDCVTKGVKFVHCYAAGFEETGLPEASEAQRQLVGLARQGGIRMLGPNCMGIYNPSSGMSFNVDFPTEKGPVAFVSQSGAESMRLVFLLQDVNLHFSKVVSYGNAADIDAPELFEYLAQDDETRVVACYVEGVKDGPRFVQAVRQCMLNKPVVMLKAGLSESGATAAASHTASLAGSRAIWDAFFRQTGAIQANTMDDVADSLQALVRLKPAAGRRVALVGRGGGIGVVAADICDRAGLKVPHFHPTTVEKLASIIPEAGAGIRNPVETTAGLGGAVDFYHRGLPIVDADPNTDVILVQTAVDVYGGHREDMPRKVTDTTDALLDVIDSLKKPVAVAFFSGGHPDTVIAVTAARDRLTKRGVPVYPGVESASRAISKLIAYHENARKQA